MTTETTIMAILERANPVPPGELVDVPVGATRYLETALEQRSEPMTIVDPTPTRTPDQPRRRRGTLVAVAASIVAIVVASIALIVATRDDTTVVDQPAPTVPPTVAPAPTTAAPTDVGEAQAVVDEFFAAYNAARTDEMLSLLADDVRLTVVYNGFPPDPDNTDLVPLSEFENFTAWEHAQGQQWADPVCDVADEQQETGSTLSCQWETRDVVMQAVDGASAASRALIVVSHAEIVELHLVYAPAFDTLAGRFDGWLALYHPEVEGASCCEGDTRDESERNGRLRAEWASQWATWLETWGCDVGELCTIDVNDWVVEYSTQCAALSPTDPIDGLVAHMTGIPRVIGNAAANRLFDADQSLTDGTLPDEQVSELQQRRLDAMIELGIDERCHPIID